MFSLLVSLIAALKHDFQSGGRFAWLYPKSKIYEILEGIHDLNLSVGSLAVVCHTSPHFAVNRDNMKGLIGLVLLHSPF